MIMTKAAQSIFIFGIYYVSLGVSLIVVPNVILDILGEPGTTEVWIRVAGVILLLLGYFYIQSTRKNITDLFILTVQARSTVIIFFTAFVLLGYAPPILILFGAVDLCGALWTFKELKDRSKSS